MVGGLEVLRAVLDPAYGRAEVHGGEGDQEVLGVELAAGAETAAHRRLDEVDRALGQSAQLREDAPVGVGHLGGAPDREHRATVVVLRHQAAGFERDRGMTIGLEGLLDDEVTLGERTLHIARLHLEAGGLVSRHRVVEPGRLRCHGRARVDHRREILVDHLHQLQRVLGDVPVPCHHHGHGLAHVAHPVGGYRGLLRPFQTG